MLYHQQNKQSQCHSINIHVYPSPFKFESRILKITKTLADTKVFKKIYIFATWELGLPIRENLDDKREVIRINRNLGYNKSTTLWKFLKTLEWSLKILKRLRYEKVECINCHSLPMLPLCIFLKMTKQSKLIYDTHELETETANSFGLRKAVLKVIERIGIEFVDEIITVNDSIATWYKQKYKLKEVFVVKNVPITQPDCLMQSNKIRESLGIPKNEVVFIYQGALSNVRGIELLLKVFSRLNINKHLILMGFGELIEKVKKYSHEYSNIHYLPAVGPEDILEYTSSADVGIHLIENTCLNHYYCLPNKIWEYIYAGIPIIVSDLPEMGKVVDLYQCGWKCDSSEDAAIRVIENITLEAISEKKNNVAAARGTFGWQFEEPKLLCVYKNLGFNVTHDN